MSKVQGVRSQLPNDAEDPVIVKGTGQQFALMRDPNPNMTPEQITEYIERVLRRVSTIEGVAEVQVLAPPNIRCASGSSIKLASRR